MKELIQKNKVFLILYLLFLITGAFIIFFVEKGNEIVYFNALHTPFFDQFFKWITRLAEIPLMVLILIAVFITNYGNALVLLLNNLVVFLFTSFFKHIVFSNELRPAGFFDGKMQLKFVQGVDVLRYNSFPSGHTASAFAIALMLSLLIKNKKWSAPLFVVALLIGVSRVYLLQHFFRDVYFGSLEGVIVTLVVYFTFVQSSLLQDLSWKDKRLTRS